MHDSNSSVPLRSEPSLRIAIVSGHRLLGDLLGSALRGCGHEVVNAPSSSFEEIRARAFGCDAVVVCTWNLPRRGRHLIRSLCDSDTRQRIIAVDEAVADAESHELLLAGALAVIGSRLSLQESLPLFEAACRGDSRIGTERSTSSMPSVLPDRPLTMREVEILQLVADGTTIASMAQRLFISAKTVKHHLSAIYAKLGVSNRTDAVVLALRRGIIDLHRS